MTWTSRAERNGANQVLPRFPAVLYGDTSATRRGWRRLLQRVWTADSFDVLEPSDMLPIDNSVCDVIIDMIPPDNFKYHQCHWWPLWIAKDRPSRIKSARTHGERSKVFREAVVREQKLLLEGMRTFWFTVGLLSGLSDERRTDYRAVLGEDTMDKVVLLPMLRHFVAWLPELAMLEDRYGCTVIRYRDVRNFKYAWFTRILGLFYRFGYKEFRQTDWRRAIDKRYHGNVIEALLAKKYIRATGDRFELNER